MCHRSFGVSARRCVLWGWRGVGGEWVLQLAASSCVFVSTACGNQRGGMQHPSFHHRFHLSYCHVLHWHSRSLPPHTL